MGSKPSSQRSNLPALQETQPLEAEHPLIGAAVRKRFGRKVYSGTVASFDSAEAWFRVVFEDGRVQAAAWNATAPEPARRDEEEFDEEELRTLLESARPEVGPR